MDQERSFGKVGNKTMTRPDIDEILETLQDYPETPAYVLRAVGMLVQYILHLEHELAIEEPYDAPENLAKIQLEKKFDPRNVPEFLELVRKQNG